MLRLSIFLVTVVLTLTAARNDWWENGNFYQVYPRSFKDSNGDGVGDLKGVAQKMQYLKDIGMDGVWLSPIFASPMADFGYDISDYYKVHWEYGTNQDLFDLIQEAHRLGLRLILDFVPNHTSDEHEWFQRSIAGDPEYRDYYIWHDGVLNVTTGQRQPPSNWLSQFRYTAWQWNEQRQQYYLHQFGVKQPELNYRNPKVVEAMKDVLRFWLDHGIDGFRIDAVPFLFEVDVDPATGTYPDEPVIDDVSSCPDPDDWCHLKHPYTNSLPEDIDMVYQWRKVVDQFKRDHSSDTKVLLTEAYTSFKNLMLMYGDSEHKGANVPFNFEMLAALTNKSRAADYKYYAEHWLNNMPEGVFANWVLGNHDNKRLASRLGPQRTDLLNIFLQTLPGIAVTYNGEEYGMEDVNPSWEDSVDPQACNASPETYLIYSRDPARTPFRWDSSPNAGFSTANRTWLPVGPGYEESNVAVQLAASKSHLKVFKRLVELRKSEPAFDNKSFDAKVIDEVLLYKREAMGEGDDFIVVLNIGDSEKELNLTEIYAGVGDQVEVAVSSIQSGIDEGQLTSARNFVAKPYLGYVLRNIA